MKFNFLAFLKKVVKTIVSGLKPPRAKYEEVRFPRQMYKLLFAETAMNLLSSVLSTVVALAVSLVNSYSGRGNVLVAFLFLILFFFKDTIFEVFNSFRRELNSRNDEYLNDSLFTTCANLYRASEGRVRKRENGYETVMDREEHIDTINQYVSTLWKMTRKWPARIFRIVSTIILVISTLKTTNLPSTSVIVLIFLFVELLIRAASFISRNESLKKRESQRTREKRLLNDILRVVILFIGDFTVRINRFANVRLGIHKSERTSRKYANCCTTLSSTLKGILLLVIAFTIFDPSEGTSETFRLTVMSLFSIVSQAITNVRELVVEITEQAEEMYKLELREETMEEVIGESREVADEIPVDILKIEPLSLTYKVSSENDKQFKLISKEAITFEKGDVICLTGSSGSGKSTFMKIAVGQLRTDGSLSHISPNRYVLFDEKTTLGSPALFFELFNINEFEDEVYEPTLHELEKMKEILSSLKLWDEFTALSNDTWRYLKEHFYLDLSNGQKQRIVIAKILYWLDENIDIVCLDECTSGLDEVGDETSANAKDIIRYIVDMCNKDRKRITFISTHQTCVQEMFSHELNFQKVGNESYIHEKR